MWKCSLLSAVGGVVGRCDGQVSHDEKNLIVDGKKIRAFQEKEAGNIKWGECIARRGQPGAPLQLQGEG